MDWLSLTEHDDSEVTLEMLENGDFNGLDGILADPDNYYKKLIIMILLLKFFTIIWETVTTVLLFLQQKTIKIQHSFYFLVMVCILHGMKQVGIMLIL